MSLLRRRIEYVLEEARGEVATLTRAVSLQRVGSCRERVMSRREHYRKVEAGARAMLAMTEAEAAAAMNGQAVTVEVVKGVCAFVGGKVLCGAEEVAA